MLSTNDVIIFCIKEMHSSKVYASIEGKNCESWICTNDEQHLKQHGTILYT